MGWECPRCHSTYAPFVQACEGCAKKAERQAFIQSIPAGVAAKELTPEEILKPMSPLDELSDDEIRYYATPYYDQLQAEKAQRAEQIKMGEELNANH